MLRAIAEMVAAVDVPVTADILAGMGDSIEGVVATVKEVIALGAAGVNIEDSTEVGGAHLLDIAYQTEKIRAVCAAVEASGVPIVVNARTDAYWLKLGNDKERLRTSIERANRYRDAGAHCLFVPGTTDRATLKTLVAEISGPLNVLATPGCPPVAELQALGVRRVSEGSGPMRASLMLARRIARDLIDTGTYARFHGDAIPYDEANALFRRGGESGSR
jgi:2-methylisocitrate lyase-like PEP mutase family enzyme